MRTGYRLTTIFIGQMMNQIGFKASLFFLQNDVDFIVRVSGAESKVQIARIMVLDKNKIPAIAINNTIPINRNSMILPRKEKSSQRQEQYIAMKLLWRV